MTQWKRVFSFLAATVALAGSFACVNVFDPIDNPSGDRQLLSAARAAFDKGDIATARELYGKVNSDETARAESIFLDLDGCGADIGAFASALSKAADTPATPGVLLSIMGERMYARNSTACFATLLTSYKAARAINDQNLRGFATFLSAIAISGEVLANNTGIPANGLLEKADLYTDPTTCIASCAGCTKADGITASVAVTLDSATTIDASYGTLKGAIVAANTALGELGITSGPSTNLVAPLSAADSNNDGIFSCAIAQIGVGR